MLYIPLLVLPTHAGGMVGTLPCPALPCSSLLTMVGELSVPHGSLSSPMVGELYVPHGPPSFTHGREACMRRGGYHPP